MGKFIHNPDDYIIIDDLIVPLSWFLTQEPAYSLPGTPPNLIAREYVQGSYHILRDDISQFAGEYPWTDGDTYITNKATYAADYETYINPPPTLSQAKEIRINEMLGYSNSIKLGKVVYNTGITDYTFESDSRHYDRLHAQWHNFVEDGDVPGGFYVRDEDGTEHSFTLVQLTELINKTQDLYHEVYLTIDDHIDAINALATVPAVETYDFTTGWITVPYDPA